LRLFNPFDKKLILGLTQLTEPKGDTIRSQIVNFIWAPVMILAAQKERVQTQEPVHFIKVFGLAVSRVKYEVIFLMFHILFLLRVVAQISLHSSAGISPQSIFLELTT
jgi:hypothetical protein